MTATEGTVIVVAALAIVAIALVIRNRARTSVDFEVGGIKLSAKGSNDPAPGAVIEGATSRKGGATAEDETGKGAVIRDTDVETDLKAINRNPENLDPKE